MNPIKPFVDHNGVFVLDGGLATQLEQWQHIVTDFTVQPSLVANSASVMTWT